MAQDRISTGIQGLDYLLKGGLLRNAGMMVEGTPGTGKSTLAMQFIVEGIKMGSPGVYVTLEEYPSELYRDALHYGWDLRKYEKQDKVRVVATSPQALKQQIETGGPLLSEIRSIGAKRIVIDSVNQFERISTEPSFLRTTLGGLVNAFKLEDMTSMFTKDIETASPLEYWGRYTVDILIELSFELMKARERRRLIEVHKARGQDHVLGRHTFKITDEGIKIFPRPTPEAIAAVAEAHPAAERVQSGIEGLDRMLGGGYVLGHNVLLAGGAGTGKTLTAVSFACAGLKEDQSTLYISMEDPPKRILQNATSVGIDLSDGIRSGKVEMIFLPPVELSPDELLYEVESRLQTGRFQRLVIDSISSLKNVTPEPEYLHDVIYSLASACYRYNVTGIFIAEVEEMTGPFKFTDFGGAFIADAIILLRLVEVSGELKKAISVVKMRGTEHDPSLREMIFTHQGLKIGPQFENLSGLLTGVPTAQRPIGIEPYFGELDPEQERVAHALAERREATTQEIAQATGLDPGRVQAVLNTLTDMGFVTKFRADGETRYRPALMRAR